MVLPLMSEVFDKAAVRHLRDADHLDAAGRRANADHLYGFAAECAVKAALVTALGAPLSHHHRQHVDVLWGRALLQGLQKRFPALAALLKAPNPFDNWSTDQRYDDGVAITPEVVEGHRKAARRLLGCVRLTYALSEAQP
jgi:hypothetical protein